MATVEITAENFKDHVKSGITVLDFWAEWCGPCRMFGPTFEAVSEQHPEVTFGKVNTEEQTELAQAFQVMSIPTVMVFRDGIRLFGGPGALNRDQLQALVKQASELDMDEVRAQLEQADAQQ
ncbi:thioredoxin [Arcanobacterium pinnipediorum]|uniref:Thioredoxin n=1 Tax=Arcanobacterium pinnipediorum TaxID=1503041 RepID=A0ABY5AF34_9ACTO|nr:thioredoxin [Arcanobacterium pinnipediorum]USR78827.1 thioredoxin [Arcanobacterium pinnipediorum]